ncbi:hypothetical protein ACLOJK_026412 [Asimina triloba]
METLVLCHCSNLHVLLSFLRSLFHAQNKKETRSKSRPKHCSVSMISRNCDEAYRLDESGNLHVPHDATDEFCSGPCYGETKLVLNCINGILKHFLFYNKASVVDVRRTIYAACSYTNKRGNFDVASYLEGEYSAAAHKLGLPFPMFVAMVGGTLMLI